jgi:hypothetical protein
MAVLDLSRSRATDLRGHPPQSTAAEERQSTWQHPALGLAGTFLVLTGIGIGILTLRFVLVLMHGILQ